MVINVVRANGPQTRQRLRKEREMNNSTQQNTEAKTNRIQVDNLPQQEKELKDQEAEKVKGGGGVSGGVLRQAGEEIPQTTRK